MSYRVFVDSAGAEWQAWDIVPRLSERRNDEGADRRMDIVAIRFLDRRAHARRLAQNRRSVMRGTYGHGWLCFENSKEKRRLSPIPLDWTTCSDEVLGTYACCAELVAGGPHRPFTFLGDEPLAEAG